MDADDVEDMVGPDLRKHCAEHAGWRSDCEACKAANYLFEGEPERCSLCQEPGHTHDDHWLFQHDAVKALQAQLRERETELKTMVGAIETDKQFFRKEFIRDAAVRIYVAGMGGVEATHTESGAKTIIAFTPLTCWLAAQELWKAKPEDC